MPREANSSGRARTVGPDTGTASTSGSSSWLNPTRISYVAAADRRRQRLLKRIDERQATPSTSAASSTQKTEEEAEERLQGEQAPKISMTRGRWPINVWTDEVEFAVKTTVSTAAPTGGSKEWSFTPPTTPRVLATPRTQARLLRRIRLGSSERPEKRNAEEHGGTPAVASAREDVDDSVQCLTWFPTTAARVQPQVDAEPLPTWRRPVSRRRLNKYLKRDAIEQEPPVETVTELSVGSVLDLDYHCEPHYHSEPHVGTTFEPLLGVDADVRYYSAPAAQSEEVGGSQVRRLRLLRSRHQETGDTEATRSSRRELLHSLLES